MGASRPTKVNQLMGLINGIAWFRVEQLFSQIDILFIIIKFYSEVLNFILKILM